jgi:hypothetical protein
MKAITQPLPQPPPLTLQPYFIGWSILSLSKDASLAQPSSFDRLRMTAKLVQSHLP